MYDWSHQCSQGVCERREVDNKKGGKGLRTCWRGLSRPLEGDCEFDRNQETDLVMGRLLLGEGDIMAAMWAEDWSVGNGDSARRKKGEDLGKM